MRVCILTTCYPRWCGDPSGPFVEALVQQLIKDYGCQIHVVAPHAPGTPDWERHDNLEIHRFRYAWPSPFERLCYDGGIPTSLHLRPWTVALVPGLLGSFVRKATECIASCDVVHCHWMVSGFVGLLARSVHARPVVVTAHGSDISLAQRTWALRAINQHVIRRGEAVTTVGSAQRSDLIRLGGIPEKIHHIPLGVSEEFLRRAPSRDKSVDILFVGRLTPEKRPELLVAALAELARRGLPLTAELVGDGPLRDRVEAMIRGENLREVRLLGSLPHAAVLEAMDRARCLVLVSNREGVPTVVVEAMARGLAVLSCDVGSVSDVIAEGQTGWLMRADVQPQDVAARIEEIFSDEQRLEAISAAGREFVRKYFTWQASSRRFHALYWQVLADRKRHGG